MGLIHVDRADPLPASLKSSFIPEIAVKMLLPGAKAAADGDQMILSYEGEDVRMHAKDFALAKRVAQRVALLLPKKISPAVIIRGMSDATRICAEEVFSEGALRVIYFPILQEASAFPRCILPALALNGGTRVTATVSSTKSPREALDYDVVVFQIEHAAATLRTMRTLQQMGKRCVYEIDDAFDQMESWHPNYAYFSRPETRKAIFDMMEAADLVTVTTPYLAERYKDKAKRIEILPNCLTPDWPVAEPSRNGTLRVLWAGSKSHFGDLAEVSGALSKFANSHDEVRLIFFGRLPAGLVVDPKQVEIHDWVELADFPGKLADLKADVAIAPLSDVPFNRAKSNLRLIQYGATGYPVIASRVGEYERTGRGFVELCSGEAEWLAALERMRDEGHRKDMRSKSAQLASGYGIAEWAPKIEELYLSLRG